MMTEPTLPKLLPAKKLKVFIVEEDRYQRQPLFQATLQLLHDAGIAGATVIKHDEGFGERREIHTTKLEIPSMNLPLTIEAVDTPEKIDAITPQIAAMVTSGLVEVSRTMMLRPALNKSSAQGGALC
jgi:PII-like signaling protein